ncbi:unnamed protein product, partial [Tetraodon nigroviridis]
TNLILLSMAVSDLLVGLVVMPLMIVTLDSCRGTSTVVCFLYHLLDFILTLCFCWEHGADISRSLRGHLLPSALFLHQTKQSQNLCVSVLDQLCYLQFYTSER